MKARRPPWTVQHGLVLQRLQQRVAERLEEHGLDQRVGRLAARAVGQGDALLLELGLAAPRLLDPLEDLLLAAQLLVLLVPRGHVLVASFTRSRVKRPKL